jgi:hypothetical protein
LPGPAPAASRLRRVSRSRLCGDHEMSSRGRSNANTADEPSV